MSGKLHPPPVRKTTPLGPSLAALINGRSVAFDDAEAKFNRLAALWAEYNAGRSVTDFRHAAYLQIIGMGMPVVPLLLRELAEGRGDWVVALKYITGAKVTTPAMRGNFPAIRRAWLEWGRANGSGKELR